MPAMRVGSIALVVIALIVSVRAAPVSAQPTAAARVEAGDCQAEPLPESALIGATIDELAAQATPTAALRVDALPPGEAADAATVEAVLELERNLAACLNDGEIRRAASLMTGNALVLLRGVLATYPELADRVANPAPLPRGEQTKTVTVWEVRVLPDGQVGALVAWDDEVNFRIYRQVDGRWLLSDEIAVWGEIRIPEP